jgi:protein-S-isoprenylcysteine O-methyltransferase Ste14
MNPQKIIASYLVIQAAGTAGWWVLLFWVRDSVCWFQPSDWPADALLGFWLADFVMLVGGSSVVAAAVVAEKPWAGIAIWSLATAVWYPALNCIGVSVLTGDAWIASAMMTSMAGLTLAMATIYGNATQTPATIRVTPMSKKGAVTWTFAQTAIFWGVFLWILPKGIVELESRLGWNAVVHTGQFFLSIGLLVGASLLGAWSGITMAIVGDGTPLPTATAPGLVVRGPYRFVRNPMALAGISQGVAVGWLMGSFGVIAYSMVGAFVWHWFVRPVEEADLQTRFGEEYVRYKEMVGLWVPRFVNKRGPSCSSPG